jgi:TRAP-type C4-dicarboxylate transport system substrate-binding protein
MVFRSLDELDYVSKKLESKLSSKLEEKGFIVLYWSDAGWVRFFTKEPAILPDDLRKMKLYTWAGDSKVVDLWKSARFQPVALETSDIVPMLDTGMISAAPLPPIVALAGQIYSRTPNMLDLKWAPLVGALVIRKAVWDSIPAATQQAMREAAEEAGRQIKEHGRAESERAIETMKSKGLKVHSVTPETEDIWRKTLEEWHPRIRGSLVPPDIFDEVFRLLEELRRTQGNPKP